MTERKQYDTQQLRAGGGELSGAAEDLSTRFGKLMDECSDMSAFGPGHDTVGPIAQMIYQAVLERVNETVTSSTESWAGHGERIEMASKIYDQGEEENSQLAQMSNPGGAV